MGESKVGVYQHLEFPETNACRKASQNSRATASAVASRLLGAAVARVAAALVAEPRLPLPPPALALGDDGGGGTTAAAPARDAKEAQEEREGADAKEALRRPAAAVSAAVVTVEAPVADAAHEGFLPAASRAVVKPPDPLLVLSPMALSVANTLSPPVRMVRLDCRSQQGKLKWTVTRVGLG